MSFSDVSSVTNYFATANEGFNTTTSSITISGANTIALNSASGLTDGSIFIGVIEPGGTKEQVFTGTVDVSGSQITGVKWTKGANVEHASGSAVVDYDTGTAFNMMSKGIQKQHKQSGAHSDVTADSLSVAGAATLNGTITPNGGFAANSILKAGLEKPHYNCLYFSNNAGMVFSNTQTTAPYNTSDTTNGFGITADTTAHTLTTTREGLYSIHARFSCVDVTATAFITWIYINIGGTLYGFRRPDQSLAVSLTDSWTFHIYLPSGAIIHQEVYNGGGSTRFGTANDGGTGPDVQRRLATSLTVTEIR